MRILRNIIFTVFLIALTGMNGAAEEEQEWKSSIAFGFNLSRGNTAKVWESAEYPPEFEDFNIYLLNSEIGVETAISGRLSLRLVVQNTYDGDPAPGVKENDIVIKSSLVCNL